MFNICCGTSEKLTSEQIKERERSKAIEQALRKDDQLQKKSHHKLLLLGTGDAGKSTFAKQMSLLHSKGLSNQVIETYIPVLRENTLGGLQNLIRFLANSGIQSPDILDSQINIISRAAELTPEVAKSIFESWNNKDFQNLVREKADVAQLLGGYSGVSYYFQNAERFAKEDYVPTTEDILKARKKNNRNCRN